MYKGVIMYYPRNLENKLKDSFTGKKISIIIGPRQSGKTTLLKMLHRELAQPGLFIDLDIFENRSTFKSYSNVIKFLRFNGYDEKKPFLLFLDEFQGVPNIDMILKNLYDNQPNLKIVASGSSSLEIIANLKESLAGRKQIFNLYPLNFDEFIRFKDSALADKLKAVDSQKLPESVKKQLNDYVKEFCIFGGYPEVTLAKNPEEKKELIRSILDLYVKKDLITVLKIKNPDGAFNILRYLAINMGSILNFSDLRSSQNIDINTLKRYLNLLNETFIVKTIPPFFKNKNKEIVRAPKIYYIDPGVRNYFLKNYTEFDNRTDQGFLIENFIFSQLQKKSDFLTEIKYWRDKNNREIDFIVEREDKLFAYEVKFRNTITPKMMANLLYFQKWYPNVKSYLINIQKPMLKIETIKEMEYFQI